MRNTFLKSILLGALLSSIPALASNNDGLLTSKAKLALWTTGGVKSNSVHVDTNDGVVTLYGKVPSDMQRALAEQAAREVHGVRDVKNLLQVVADRDEKRVERSDKEIKEAVEKELHADLALKDSSISVKAVDKGLVLLTGDAHTFSDLLRAIADADRVSGVHKIATEVKAPQEFGADERVTFTVEHQAKAGTETRSSSSDMRTSASVKFRLLTTSQIPSTEINVDTDNGVVTLFGIVPTSQVKTAAGQEAGRVSGVRSVQNQLEVVASAQKKAVDAKDSDVQGDLQLAFKNHPDLSKVNTEVKNGTARLTGTVMSAWEQLSAVRVARQVAGVRDVRCDLTIDDRS